MSDQAQKRFRSELRALLLRPENRYCVDCRAEGSTAHRTHHTFTRESLTRPTWASINLGIFMCFDCAGIHRSMGTHISKVRSVTMDTWFPDWVKFMSAVGNYRANCYWECNNKYGERILPSADGPERSRFIKAKYEEKKWYGIPQPARSAINTTTPNPNQSVSTPSTTATINATVPPPEPTKPKPQELSHNGANIFAGMNGEDTSTQKKPPQENPTTQTHSQNPTRPSTTARKPSIGGMRRLGAGSPWVKRGMLPTQQPPTKPVMPETKIIACTYTEVVKFEDAYDSPAPATIPSEPMPSLASLMDDDEVPTAKPVSTPHPLSTARGLNKEIGGSDSDLLYGNPFGASKTLEPEKKKAPDQPVETPTAFGFLNDDDDGGGATFDTAADDSENMNSFGFLNDGPPAESKSQVAPPQEPTPMPGTDQGISSFGFLDDEGSGGEKGHEVNETGNESNAFNFLGDAGNDSKDIAKESGNTNSGTTSGFDFLADEQPVEDSAGRDKTLSGQKQFNGFDSDGGDQDTLDDLLGNSKADPISANGKDDDPFEGLF